MAAFMSTRKGRRATKAWNKGAKKPFEMKEQNENIPFNIYLQSLVLLVTEMHIQLYKY